MASIMTDDPKIESVEPHPAEKLIDRLRRVTMLTRPDIRVYEHADISLEHMPIEHIYPAQRYVLVQGLLRARRLEWELARFGHDLFRLDGFVKLHLAGAEHPVDLLPPVVEESVQRGGRVVNVVNDGMHRLYLAYLEWVEPRVVFIRNVPRELPYYAYPSPAQWQGIEMVDSLPEGYIKKWHRIPDYKTL